MEDTVTFVSVVVPVRNEGEGFHRCLDSLFSQDLPFGDFEVIVVDGHSSDGTREVAESYPVRLLLDGGVSVSEARNRGIRAARGDVIVFIDGDCEASPGWLRELVAPFDDPSVGGAGGGLRARSLSNFLSRFEDVSARGLYRGFITSNVAYRRSVLEAVGGFRAHLTCAEDWDLWWRVRNSGHRVVYVPSSVVVHGPEENESVSAYLHKQFWYACNDMWAFRERLADHRSGPMDDRAVRLRETLQLLGPPTIHGLGAGAIALSPLWPAAGVVGLGLLVGDSWSRTREVFREGCVDLAEAPAFFSFSCLKTFVRGCGSLKGLWDVARGGVGSGPSPSG